jgi:hypothetical protein
MTFEKQSKSKRDWEIVPADFFKPMIIDQYMHKLVKIYEYEDRLKVRCCSPVVLRDEIIRPQTEYIYLDFQFCVE